MTEQEKKIIIDMQLENVSKLLNGKVHHLTTSDHTGKVSYKYVIEYENPSDNWPALWCS